MYIFVSDNFGFPASTIALLYKTLLQVELFFNQIEKYLWINVFLHNINGVNTLEWIVVSICVPMAMLRKRLQLKRFCFCSIHKYLSLSSFCYDIQQTHTNVNATLPRSDKSTSFLVMSI